MLVIQFVLNGDDKLIDALEALKPFAVGTPKIFAPQPVTKLPSNVAEFEARAQAIARTIRPRANQPMRLDALKAVLTGHNTWFDQQGDPDPALRNATGALSKALRKFAPYDESPLEILCVRRRETVPTGPYKGRYQGTTYEVTKLGARVRDILKEMGIL